MVTGRLISILIGRSEHDQRAKSVVHPDRSRAFNGYRDQADQVPWPIIPRMTFPIARSHVGRFGTDRRSTLARSDNLDTLRPPGSQLGEDL